MEALDNYSSPQGAHDHGREAIWQAYRKGLIDPDESTAQLLALNMRERHEPFDDQPTTRRIE